VDTPHTAAWEDAPILAGHPLDCHSSEDKLRTRSHTRATNLILEDFVDLDRPDWNGFRLPQACVLPKRPQTWSSK
jgi:hypothetical protein